jgi:hypothetical protein
LGYRGAFGVVDLILSTSAWRMTTLSMKHTGKLSSSSNVFDPYPESTDQILAALLFGGGGSIVIARCGVVQSWCTQRDYTIVVATPTVYTNSDT